MENIADTGVTSNRVSSLSDCGRGSSNCSNIVSVLAHSGLDCPGNV